MFNRFNYKKCSVFISSMLAALLMLASAGYSFAAEIDSEFSDFIEPLKEKSFNKKTIAVDNLNKIKDDRVSDVLVSMLNGRLFYVKESKVIVFAEKQGDLYKITDVLTGKLIGKFSKRKLKKISTNNKLRKKIRNILAKKDLSSEDIEVRLKAVKSVMNNMTPEKLSILKSIRENEKNKEIISIINTAVYLNDLNSNDKGARLDAIRALNGSLHPQVKNKLDKILEKTEKGEYIEADRSVRDAAKKSLSTINSRLNIFKNIETLFFGISLGSVLLLSAIGLAITFGVMGVINMAHGELMMLGAYTTYVIQQMMPDHIGLSILVAIPSAFIVAGLFGIAIERGVIRFLYGRPLETLLATFGISLILQQMVRSIFSPLNRSVETPSWMSGSLEINSVLSLTYSRLYIVVFSLLVFFSLLMILKKTSLGLQVRAVSQNRFMARAMGVRSDWVDALTFGLGSGVAGVAGVALSQLTNVGPNLGQSYIIDSFMVVVFGGVGNLWGTLVGAMSLGVVSKFLEPWSGAVLAKILVLVFIILFIQKRPRGLFPQKGRAAEN